MIKCFNQNIQINYSTITTKNEWFWKCLEKVCFSSSKFKHSVALKIEKTILFIKKADFNSYFSFIFLLNKVVNIFSLCGFGEKLHSRHSRGYIVEGHSCRG